MKDLGLEENATDEEIEQVISDMVNEHLDWGMGREINSQ